MNLKVKKKVCILMIFIITISLFNPNFLKQLNAYASDDVIKRDTINVNDKDTKTTTGSSIEINDGQANEEKIENNNPNNDNVKKEIKVNVAVIGAYNEVLISPQEITIKEDSIEDILKSTGLQYKIDEDGDIKSIDSIKKTLQEDEDDEDKTKYDEYYNAKSKWYCKVNNSDIYTSIKGANIKAEDSVVFYYGDKDKIPQSTSSDDFINVKVKVWGADEENFESYKMLDDKILLLKGSNEYFALRAALHKAGVEGVFKNEFGGVYDKSCDEKWNIIANKKLGKINKLEEIVDAGDEITVFKTDYTDWGYSSFLKVNVSKDEIKTGNNVDIQVLKITKEGDEDDENPNEVKYNFTPVKAAKVYFGSKEYITDDQGKVSILCNNPGEFKIYAQEEKKFISDEVTVKVTGTSTGADEVNKKELSKAIDLAKELCNGIREGEKDGQYPVGSKERLNKAIDVAIALLNNDNAVQEQVNKEALELNGLIESVKASIVKINKEELTKLVDEAKSLYYNAQVGNQDGQYREMDKDRLEKSIMQAKGFIKNKDAIQKDINDEIKKLKEAMENFKKSVLNSKAIFKIKNMSINQEFKKDSTAKLSIEATNVGNEDREVYIVIGIYNNSGKIVKYTAAKKIIKSNKSIQINSNIKLPNIDGYKIKGFVCKNVHQFTPLSNTIDFLNNDIEQDSSESTLIVSPVQLVEGKDGALLNGKIKLEVKNGTFKQDIAKEDIKANNLPAGLDYTITRDSDKKITIEIIGRAEKNGNKDSIENLSFTISKEKIEDSKTDLTTKNIKILFSEINLECSSAETINSTTIALNMNEGLKGEYGDNNAFAVYGVKTDPCVKEVKIDQNKLVITLTKPIEKGENVIVSYNPTGNLDLKYENDKRVEHFNCPVENTLKNITVMAYVDADNNVQQYMLNDIKEIKKGLSDDPNLNVIALVDRISLGETKALGEDFTDTRLYNLKHNDAIRINGGNEFPEITETSSYEANMGDAHTLKKFIDCCKNNYAADKYVLIVFNHGAGAQGFCIDETDGDDIINIAEVSDVLTKDESVDLLVYEACLMGTSEVAYQYRPGNGSFEAEGMLASSPTMLALGLKYDKIFNRLKYGGGDNEEEDYSLGGKELVYDPATVSNLQLGAIMVEEQHDSMENYDSQVLAYYDLTKSEEVKKCVDKLAQELYKQNKKDVVNEIRGNQDRNPLITSYFNTQDDGEWASYSYFDLYDFCEKIYNNYNHEFNEDIRNAALNVMEAVDNFTIYSYAGESYKKQGFKESKNGVSIFLPDGDKYWKDEAWYNSVKNNKTDNYGGLQWCTDGQEPEINKVGNWFEMLDSWYDKNNDEKGGVNNFQW